MNKRDKTIFIDGSKLKELLESKTGKTVRELSLDNGYSDSFLRMSIKTGKASPSVITLARLYGIEPAEYEIKPAEDDTDSKQMSFDEIPTLNQADIELIRDSIRAELLNVLSGFSTEYITAQYEPTERVYKIFFKVRGGC
jgi:hypothetical protein